MSINNLQMSKAAPDKSPMIHGERVVAPFSSGDEPPRSAAPEGATDCHIHIFDPRFPRLPGREGVWATVADHLLFRRRLGLSRSIVVHPSSYGADNRALLDALDQLGDTARGVASVTPEVTDAELDRMHAQGVRAIRLYLARENPPTPAQIREYAMRLAPRGWHIQFVVREKQLIDAERLLLELPCRIVLDHFAHLAQPEGLNQPAGDTVRRLLDKGHTYLKLSCVYSVSKDPEHFSDLGKTVRSLVDLAPDRMLWGTDWPHTSVKARPKPDGAQLFDLLTDWVPDVQMRTRILVANPQALYWSN